MHSCLSCCHLTLLLLPPGPHSLLERTGRFQAAATGCNERELTFIQQLHKGYMNGLQVAVKQLRAGPCDLAIAEQLLMEEAALMQACRLTLRFELNKLR